MKREEAGQCNVCGCYYRMNDDLFRMKEGDTCGDLSRNLDKACEGKVYAVKGEKFPWLT